MPRLNSKIFDCVFYLYRRNPKTGEVEGPFGTGGIYVRMSKNLPAFHHYYGVTNWHVSHNAGASIIRINTKDGKTRFLEYDPIDWQFMPGADDLSAVDITDDLSNETDQTNVNPEDGFVTPDIIKRFEIGPGEDIFMGGLYPNHHGGDRNKPCARFGNIAMMPDEKSLVKQPNNIWRPSYLADMRSRTGFSGSPVFIYRTPQDNLNVVWRDLHKRVFHPAGDDLYEIKDRFLAILGVHCGQFWENLKVATSDGSPERLGDPIQEGDDLYVQGAMTIIVPAWRISELLNLEVFEMARQDREKKVYSEVMRQPRGEAAAPPATDENPKHREDFNFLLGVAARKQQSDD